MAKKEEEQEQEEELDDTSNEEIYSEKGREEMLENDEISPEEEGFMAGEIEEGTGSKCRNCGKVLEEIDDVIEKKINGRHCFFCSDECVNKYEKKQSKK